jgi:predicted anti-sigma-YlaC factor YlaD
MSAQETTVIVGTLAAGGINLASQLATRGRGEHLMRPVIGTFLAVGALLLLANFWPDAAAGLALVLLVTSFVLSGRPFIAVINKTLGE